jgi:hypothetical protein
MRENHVAEALQEFDDGGNVYRCRFADIGASLASKEKSTHGA